MDKRLLIHGEGALGEARLDPRANCPAFRISRNCVIRNIDVDMTVRALEIINLSVYPNTQYSAHNLHLICCC